MWKRTRRRVSIGNGLHFDYEVSPFSSRIADKLRNANGGAPSWETPPPNDELSTKRPSAPSAAKDHAVAGKIGDYVPFKQSRLKGQANPLRPPLHVETVLIGRALGQPAGYFLGVGFRVHEDGYVEAEFAGGVRKYDSYDKFEIEVIHLAGRIERA